MTYLEQFREELEGLRRDIDDGGATVEALKRVEGLLAGLADLRQEALEEILRPDLALRAFYSSRSAIEALQAAGLSGEEVQEAIGTLAAPKRRFHRANETVAVWLIELMNEGVSSGPGHLRQLQNYDHLIIDEAQYYSASLLRALIRLARPPRSAVTIVGDLDQFVGSGVGLGDWASLGLAADSGRLRRLDRLYRCSRETYRVLYDLNARLGLRSRLAPPREVDRFTSRPSDLLLFSSWPREIEWVAAQIDECKGLFPGESIIVVFPTLESCLAFAEDIVDALDARGIPARTAHGEDLEESVEKVLVTDGESVVGLEFDSVFVPGLSAQWAGADPRTLWVAASRAKRYLALTTHGGRPDWLQDGRLGDLEMRLIG